jgi:hypothetical protein
MYLHYYTVITELLIPGNVYRSLFNLIIEEYTAVVHENSSISYMPIRHKITDMLCVCTDNYLTLRYMYTPLTQVRMRGTFLECDSVGASYSLLSITIYNCVLSHFKLCYVSTVSRKYS